MLRQYTFTAEGTAADGQTWTVSSSMTCRFEETFRLAALEVFAQLTGGKAVFGKPGVGCKGPYTITRLVIELVVH